ncbi:uncharacterized protein At3g43530-like [Brassica rapa]|uniref:DUF1985 domain-containing protein n=4 Tax=Brassica TaxID=3705 RepID=A0ABQ8E2F1_BRANA|nr:uncharacterized protein At3g43530-like [Brassica napus]XP_033135041.1 uncharacterized protein At3g43530-like [Brassica rapa]XP_033135042.1 uncharacterized protein At3g43530-like [Brassica rapa]XP_048632744.1 uncharacterized protein At3g43530-like [Brassica napus]KAH0935063.1 hypothetical protein HID58_012180 [Brassica napus]
MAGRGRGRKKSQQKKSTKRNSAPVEEQHVEELSTENDSDDLSAHGIESDNQGTDNQSASSQECQPLPPDELCFKNTEFTQTCKIQSKCYVTETVKFLKKARFKPELQWFENHPQFCHFFHMPDEPNLKLQGMWMLLLRTVPLHESEDTSWFAVNGVPIRYSMREHALISGLDCHDYPAKYKKIGSFAFVDRHFKSHKEITMLSVREKLLSMSACGDRLKMAVLYFLGTIIRGKGRYNAPFDPFILRIVNDVEVCKTFPWGRLTFEDALRSITRVMKHLKGKPKNNVNFPGFIIPLEILAFECIPALKARFREGVEGCMSKCPRMCKKRFQSNSMKGYPLEDLYDTLGEIKVIESVLVPTVDEEPLMARLMDGEPDYENEEGVSNLWSTWLTVKEKPIFWQELYELDVAAREFPQKKDKRKVHEEASSSNTSLEDVLKGFEERLMTSLSEVNGKVEKMNKRLGKIERCQVVLKKRCKRMKAMEKKLEKIEDCQYYLKKKAKKVEKEMKEMKEKEEDKENNDGFDYQGMDYVWDGQRNDSNGADATTKEPEDADMVENTEVVEESEEESEEEAQKESDEVEMNEANEIEEEVETEARVEVETEARVEVETEARVEAETEARVEAETEKTPTPPRGRTKAAAARRQILTTPEKLFGKAEKMVEEEVKEPEEEGEKMVEEEVEEPEEEGEKMVEEEVLEPEEETGKMMEEEVEESEEEAVKMVEEEVVEPEEEAGRMVEEEVVEPEEEAGKMVEEEVVETEKYTEEEKQEWYMVVYEGSTCETKEADKGAAKPSGSGVKHRPKQMALRKHATKQAPKPRGRPRKDTEPKKFTTPEQTKRIRSRSQWVSTPFTEANTDEIEGRKKKPRTKA